MLLEALIGTTPAVASAIFSSVQNIRRHTMFEAILISKFGNKYHLFWKKCSSFLETLATFRNAIVHWQPCVTAYFDKTNKTQKYVHELMLWPTDAPSIFLNLRTDDISEFVTDCLYIEQEIHALTRNVRGAVQDSASADKFLKPIIRPNRAVLRRPQRSKGRQAQPKSSQKSAPKLSAKQRRTRALKMAEKKHPQ